MHPGVYGTSGSAAYSTFEHGVVGLTQPALKDIGKKGIRVTCVAPDVSRLKTALGVHSESTRRGHIEAPMLKVAFSNPNAGNAKKGGASSVILGSMGQLEEAACGWRAVAVRESMRPRGHSLAPTVLWRQCNCSQFLSLKTRFGPLTFLFIDDGVRISALP